MGLFDLTRWPTICIFAFAGLVGACFAFITVNLFTQAMESLRFLREFRFEAIEHGALWQVAELLGSGALSLFFWVAFKASEHALIERYFAWGQRQRLVSKKCQKPDEDVAAVEPTTTQGPDSVTPN